MKLQVAMVSEQAQRSDDDLRSQLAGVKRDLEHKEEIIAELTRTNVELEVRLASVQSDAMLTELDRDMRVSEAEEMAHRTQRVAKMRSPGANRFTDRQARRPCVLVLCEIAAMLRVEFKAGTQIPMKGYRLLVPRSWKRLIVLITSEH